MTYRLMFRERARKEIERLPHDIKEKVIETLLSLRESPFPAHAKKIQGFKNFYRLRVGRQYRIVYEVVKKVCIITVVKVGHRKDVYRML